MALSRLVDLQPVVVILAIGLVLVPLTIPVCLWVSLRFGLVGGTPRELVSAQLDTEKKRAEVEVHKAAAMQEDIALRKQRVTIEAELKREAMKQTANPQRHNINPQNGFRG